jgi:FHA domain
MMPTCLGARVAGTLNGMLPPRAGLIDLVLVLVAGLVLFRPAPARAQDSAMQGDAVARAAERATLLRYCQRLDQSAPATIDGIRDRTDCWKRMQLEGMGDSLVNASYQAAVADYDAAVRSDSVRLASDSSAAAVDRRIEEARAAIAARDLDRASRAVDAVLAVQPANQRALAFQDRIDSLRRTALLRRVLFLGAAGVLLLALGLAFGARVLHGRHVRRVAAQLAEAAQRKAMVEVIDGIGRGRLYTMEGPVFRIGSAESDRPEERNDLILSDAGAYISRFHCSIVRKDGRFFLIDSSLNGTYVDDQLLSRGEPHALQDGSEFSLAGMSRLKFLLM